MERIDGFLEFAQSGRHEPVTMSELVRTGLGAATVKILQPVHLGAAETKL